VTAAVALLGYAFVLLTAGVLALSRAGWPDRAPRLAVAAWLALLGSAVASVVLGGLALVLPAAGVSTNLARLLAACAMALRDQYAHPGGAALAGLGAALAVGVTGRVIWCAAGTFRAASRARSRHRRGLTLAGRPDRRLGAVIIDHDEPAAWCLPGAGRPVVLTSAAIRALGDAELAAVIAHERAHQRGRHHLLVGLAGSLTAAFPRVPAFRTGHQQVARLVELIADDAAAATSPRLTVAGALLTVAAPAPAGAAALGAGGSATAARIRRLIAAPAPLGRAATATGLFAVAVAMALPLVLLTGPAFATSCQDHCLHPGMSPAAAAGDMRPGGPAGHDSPRCGNECS
jgi:Zn-dependent protease with chaperone function